MIANEKEIKEPYNVFLARSTRWRGCAEGWVTTEIREGRPFMTVTLDEASVSMAGR